MKYLPRKFGIDRSVLAFGMHFKRWYTLGTFCPITYNVVVHLLYDKPDKSYFSSLRTFSGWTNSKKATDTIGISSEHDWPRISSNEFSIESIYLNKRHVRYFKSGTNYRSYRKRFCVNISHFFRLQLKLSYVEFRVTWIWNILSALFLP